MHKPLLVSLLASSAITVHGFEPIIDTPQDWFDWGISPTKTLKLLQLNPEFLSVDNYLQLYPLTSSRNPEATPLVPEPDDEGDDLYQMTSLIANLDLNAAPMSLSLSTLTSLPAGLDSLPAAAIQTLQGGLISAEQVQSEYQHIYQMIDHIERTKPLHKGAYDTGKDYYEVSPAVLRALNEVLGVRLGSESVPSRTLEMAFRSLFCTLHINLFWRITDHTLLVNLFTLYFNGSTVFHELLNHLESLLDSVVQRGVITHDAAGSLQIHILSLISQQMNHVSIQALLRRRLYTAAFLAIILPDSHIQKRLSFGGFAHRRNFDIRRGNYGSLFTQLQAYLVKMGFEPLSAEAFFDYLLQLMRRGNEHFMAMGGASCQPAPTQHVLETLNQYVASNPQHFDITFQVLTSPLVFQTVTVFLNHVSSPQFTDSVNLIGQMHSLGLPQGNIQPELNLALWGLQSLAMTTPVSSESAAAEELSIILAELGVESPHLQMMATHLLRMIQRYHSGLLQGNLTMSEKTDKVKQFLKNLILGKLPINPVIYLPPRR